MAVEQKLWKALWLRDMKAGWAKIATMDNMAWVLEHVKRIQRWWRTVQYMPDTKARKSAVQKQLGEQAKHRHLDMDDDLREEEDLERGIMRQVCRAPLNDVRPLLAVAGRQGFVVAC